MNRIRFFLFVFFCLCVGINNRIIHSQYSTNNKYCRKSDNCFLYDNRIDMIDDGTIKETPYNFRPIK